MTKMVKKSFDAPDEIRSLEKSKTDSICSAPFLPAGVQWNNNCGNWDRKRRVLQMPDYAAAGYELIIYWKSGINHWRNLWNRTSNGSRFCTTRRKVCRRRTT